VRCSVRRNSSAAFALRVLLYLALCASPARAEMPEWWKNPAVRQRLSLTTGQAASIDLVFRRSLPERRRLRQELDRLEAQLAAALQLGVNDEESILALIDKVEHARARRNIARNLMLLRMHRILTPPQRRLLADTTYRRIIDP
jgi:Spy/CpxP family protein refolding chaperone